MKNNLKYLYTFLFVALFISSCRDEDTIRIPTIKDGISVKVTVDPALSFIDFTDLANSKFAFDVTTSNKDLQKVEFSVNYFDINKNKTYPAQLISTVTTFPAKVEITAQQLADLFALPGGTAFFEGADQFNFTTKAYLTDGRTFDASNSSPTMVATAATSSFTSKFATFVGGCTSNFPAGTWTGTVPDTDPVTHFGTSTSNTSVTIKPVTGKKNYYAVSDVSGAAYEPFGFKKNQPVQIEDVCGTIFIRNSTGSEVNIVTNASMGFGPGTYNATTKTITLPWYDASNGIGNVTTFTLN